MSGYSVNGIRRRVFTVFPILFLLFTIHFSLFTTVHAAPLTEESPLNFQAENPRKVTDEGNGLYTSFAKLFAGLAVVIGIMLIVYHFAKERLGKSGVIAGKGKMINVVASHYLSPKKAVMVLEVAGEYLVVGVGEEINLLTRIGDGGQEPVSGGKRTDFAQYLKNASSSEGSTGIIESIKLRVERLKGKK